VRKHTLQICNTAYVCYSSLCSVTSALHVDPCSSPVPVRQTTRIINTLVTIRYWRCTRFVRGLAPLAQLCECVHSGRQECFTRSDRSAVCLMIGSPQNERRWNKRKNKNKNEGRHRYKNKSKRRRRRNVAGSNVRRSGAYPSWLFFECRQAVRPVKPVQCIEYSTLFALFTNTLYFFQQVNSLVGTGITDTQI